MKALITTSTYSFLKHNWKKKTGKVFFGLQSLGAQTGIPVSQMVWILDWVENYSEQPASSIHFFKTFCRSLFFCELEMEATSEEFCLYVGEMYFLNLL